VTATERRVIEAARRWYRSTNEAELAEAVQQYEAEERARGQGAPAQAALPL
jgi:hypothetical protein